MPIEDYPHLTLWKKLGLDKLPLISFEKMVAPYQEKAVKRALETSVFHIVLDVESRDTWLTLLRDEVAVELKGKLQAKADEVQWSKGRELLEAQKAARLKGTTAAKDLGLSPPLGGGIKFNNNELWALKQCYQELQACIREVRRANDIPLKNTQRLEWDKASALDLTALSPWLESIFDEKELPLIVLSSSVAGCALNILFERLKGLKKNCLRYEISKNYLKELLKNFKIV